MDHPLDPSVRIRLAEVFDRLQEPDLATMWRKAAAELQARQR
jgi:hypothetical protein